MESLYGEEKLLMAMYSLTGSGSQRERLVNAVSGSLIYITPENDLPKEIRSEFEEFIKEITSVAADRGEGSIQATVNNLDDAQIGHYIEKVIGFYDTIKSK